MAVPPDILVIDQPVALKADLLAWFAQVKRDLPWRQSNDLYGIWVSEVMLQQTTVQAVVPYWERFMARFPSVRELAAAPLDDVLALWSGLGYYTRARHLHRAAVTIVTEMSGQLPASRQAWAELPGVGPYASGAIASIGLGERVPALDANARRVLQRWSVTDLIRLRELSPRQREKLVDNLGAVLVPMENPGRWNEALMELGALICGARTADCGVCPVRAFCGARLQGWVDDVPPPVNKTIAEPVWVGQLLVTWRGRALVVPAGADALPFLAPGRAVARSDFKKLYSGLWGLPMTSWLVGHDEPVHDDQSWAEWLDLPPELVLAPSPISLAGTFRHSVTKYRMRVSVLHLPLDSRLEMPPERLGRQDAVRAGSPCAAGLFFNPKEFLPPVSRLGEKGLHFHQDSLV